MIAGTWVAGAGIATVVTAVTFFVGAVVSPRELEIPVSGNKFHKLVDHDVFSFFLPILCRLVSQKATTIGIIVFSNEHNFFYYTHTSTLGKRQRTASPALCR